MTRSATGRFLASFCLTMLVGAAALADPTRDRLFVLVSPPHVAGPSAIVAFDIGSDGIPVQAGSCSTGGTGLGQNSPQGVVTDSRGRFLFAANNESNTIAAFDVADDGSLDLSGQTATETFAQALTSAADDTFLYAATPFQPAVLGFAADATASVALPSSPFPAEYTAIELLASPDSSRLYQVNAQYASILPMAIETNGDLSIVAHFVDVDTDDDSKWQST